jgi:hypothetical protein
MNDHTRPVTVGNWILTLIILAIPFLNVVMIIYWATSLHTHPSKRTYCQACILLLLIGIAIVFVGYLLGILFQR